MWILARAKLLGGTKYYGSYLGGFPERARALLGASINEPVLRVCGGLSRLYPYQGGFGPNDATLDLDINTDPTYHQDATEPYPLGYKAVLADPPYSVEDAAHYKPGSESLPVAERHSASRPGRRSAGRSRRHHPLPRSLSAGRHAVRRCGRRAVRVQQSNPRLFCVRTLKITLNPGSL